MSGPFCSECGMQAWSHEPTCSWHDHNGPPEGRKAELLRMLSLMEAQAHEAGLPPGMDPDEKGVRWEQLLFSFEMLRQLVTRAPALELEACAHHVGARSRREES